MSSKLSDDYDEDLEIIETSISDDGTTIVQFFIEKFTQRNKTAAQKQNPAFLFDDKGRKILL